MMSARLTLLTAILVLAPTVARTLAAAEAHTQTLSFEDEVSAVRIKRIRHGRGGQLPQVWLHRIPGEKNPGLSGESVRCYRLAKAYLVEHVAAAFGIRPERVFCPKWMVETRYEIYFEMEHGGKFARDALKRILMERFEIKVEPHRVIMPALVLSVVEGRAPGPVSSRQSCNGASAPVVAGPAATGAGSVAPGGGFTFSSADAPLSPNPPQVDWAGGTNPIEFYQGCEIAEIVPTLERKFRSEVFDETGITGRFDFRIPTPASVKSVNRSLERHNGLKLSEQPREMDVLVVVSGKKL